MIRFLSAAACVLAFAAPSFAQQAGLPAGLMVGPDGLVYTLAGAGPVCGGTEFMQTGIWPTDALPTIADMPTIGRPLSCPDVSESRRPVDIARRPFVGPRYDISATQPPPSAGHPAPQSRGFFRR